MKASLPILGLTSLLATSVFARPRAKVFNDGDPISQRSQVTAFVITDEGVKVECWQVGDLLPDSQQSSRQNGISKKSDGGLQGVDLLTWAAPTPIWPPPTNSLHALDSSSSRGLYTITTGLIDIQINTHASSNLKTMDDWDAFDNAILSAENGDNWYYFEDARTDDDDDDDSIDCAKGKAKATSEPPLAVSTRSATDTTLIHFKFDTAPSHTVLHPGKCRFSGLEPVIENDRWNEDRRLHRLRTQEL